MLLPFSPPSGAYTGTGGSLKLTVLASIALLAAPVTDLIRLHEAPLGEGLPPGWSVRPVSGSPPPEYSLREEAGERVLHVEGMGAAAWAYNELDSPLEAGDGILHWSWRVLQLPGGTDLRLEEKDDAALRLYVVFGKPGSLLARRSRIIFYTWGNKEPEGLTLESFASANFQIVRVAGSMDVGEDWNEQRVQPFVDYRRFWKREPPPITAVGLMQDTDMTGGMAVSELRSLEWEAR